MVKINQVTALVAEPFLDLTHDPWRTVSDRVHP
jgi:hypothetical protein